MGHRDPRLAEGTFDKEEDTQGSRFHAGSDWSPVSARSNLSEFGDKL